MAALVSGLVDLSVGRPEDEAARRRRAGEAHRLDVAAERVGKSGVDEGPARSAVVAHRDVSVRGVTLPPLPGPVRCAGEEEASGVARIDDERIGVADGVTAAVDPAPGRSVVFGEDDSVATGAVERAPAARDR